jgi:flagellar basal-body rod protein FlgC
MNDPLAATIRIAASGLSLQSTRMRVVAENLANAQVTASTPGGEPYRRKVIEFSGARDFDGALGLPETRITQDRRPFRSEFAPGHPAADASGRVLKPNVEPLIELADMREANRSYLANLQIIRQAREAISATLDLLRTS